MNTARSVESGIAILTIQRPEVRNAIDRETALEIHRALADFAADPAVGCLILTGAGEKVFVSGADIGELRGKRVRDAMEAVNSTLFTAVERFPKPTIAAVNGYALGGGCELALACDLRVAAERAKFGFPETGLGIMPAAGATQRLPRIVGLGRAKELILTGEIIDAQRALEIGLVNAVAPDAVVAARQLARKILSRAPVATRLAKASLNLAISDFGLSFESASQGILYETKDKLEGTTAFLEKRPPKFVGE